MDYKKENGIRGRPGSDRGETTERGGEIIGGAMAAVGYQRWTADTQVVGCGGQSSALESDSAASPTQGRTYSFGPRGYDRRTPRSAPHLRPSTTACLLARLERRRPTAIVEVYAMCTLSRSEERR